MKLDRDGLRAMFTYHPPSAEQAGHYKALHEAHRKSEAALKDAYEVCISIMSSRPNDKLTPDDLQPCYEMVNDGVLHFLELANELLPDDVNRSAILKHCTLARMWTNLRINETARRTGRDLPYEPKAIGHLQDAAFLVNAEIANYHVWRELPAAGSEPRVMMDRIVDGVREREVFIPNAAVDAIEQARAEGGFQKAVEVAKSLEETPARYPKNELAMLLKLQSDVHELQRQLGELQTEHRALELSHSEHTEDVSRQMGELWTAHRELEIDVQAMQGGAPDPMWSANNIGPRPTVGDLATDKSDAIDEAVEREAASEAAILEELNKHKPEPFRATPEDSRFIGKRTPPPAPPPTPRLADHLVPKKPAVWVEDDNTDEKEKA